jgi:hypothetical protein
MEEVIGIIFDAIQLIFELIFQLIHFVVKKLGYSEKTERWLTLPFIIIFVIIAIPLLWLIGS